MQFQKITPFLWFNHDAEKAVNFYCSIFKNSKIGSIMRYPEGSMLPAGTLMTASFELEGIQFTALNGGPKYVFNHAISFVIACENQSEIDYYWDRLLEHGEADQCGWLRDQFGLSWQVVPKNIGQLLSNPNAVQAMFQMVKIDIETLENAGK